MSIKANAQVRFKLRPQSQINMEVGDAVLVGLIKWVQEVVREIVKPPPIGSPFDTGRNRRSIGWMVSPVGKISFGSLSTVGGGRTSGGGLITEGDSFAVAIASSSGYGGWLEIGTKRMAARPHIVPNVVRKKKELDRFLSDTV